MDRSTAEEWRVIARESMANRGRVADRVLGMLGSLDEVVDGFTSSRTACRRRPSPKRAGADDELVLACCVSDIGKAVGVPNRPRIAADPAALLVGDRGCTRISRAATTTTTSVATRRHASGPHDHPSFADGEALRPKWDQIAFDPAYDTLALEHFRATRT